jgi:hypothetical protein
MITGFNAHPGRFPYGEAARTRSTLSSHFSPKPPALRFQGEGTWDAATAAREVAPPALRGRNGDPGAGAEVASLASAAGAHVALAPPPASLIEDAISASPTSDGHRWCPPSPPDRGLLGRDGAAGFSTNKVTRAFGGSSQSSLLLDNELAALFRPPFTAIVTRTNGSSPRQTCANARSTVFEIDSNDFVR